MLRRRPGRARPGCFATAFALETFDQEILSDENAMGWPTRERSYRSDRSAGARQSLIYPVRLFHGTPHVVRRHRRNRRQRCITELLVRSMQDVIEEIIRWLGWGALKIATLGRYRGGAEQDRLREGAIGLGIVIAAAYVFYVLVDRYLH